MRGSGEKGKTVEEYTQSPWQNHSLSPLFLLSPPFLPISSSLFLSLPSSLFFLLELFRAVVPSYFYNSFVSYLEIYFVLIWLNFRLNAIMFYNFLESLLYTGMSIALHFSVNVPPMQFGRTKVLIACLCIVLKSLWKWLSKCVFKF